MDRNIVYPSSIPLDVDILNVNRNAMLALGYLMRATLGTGSVVDGLGCAAIPGALAVSVAPGSLTIATSIDATAYGSLAADGTDPLIKMGINIVATSLPVSAPANPGQSQNFLIEAAFSETDATPVTLPYVNAANPAEPYSGPANSGVAQNTTRTQRVELVAKAGVPAPTGSQVTPAADAGFIGLYVVTVDYGQMSVSAGNIVTVPAAPFLAFKLPQLAPGVSRATSLTFSGSWTVPASVTLIRVRCWGAGGGGGNGGGTGYAGGGGAGGGYVEAYFSVVAGTVLAVTIGAAGAAASAGGATSLGTIATATGGGGGATGSAAGLGLGSVSPGNGSVAGVVSGSPVIRSGTGGGNALSLGSGLISGSGGGADGRPGAGFAGLSTAGNLAGNSAPYPGAGGSGGLGTGSGGLGAAGQIVIEW